MKSFIITLICLSVSLGLWAQAPEQFHYQGIARNNSGTPLASKALGLRISILDGTATGPVEYVETHLTTTNTFGLYTLAIGNGTVVSGSMNDIDWSSGTKFVKIEIDPSGGTSYTVLGTSQLLSVPYAMFATHGGTVTANGTPNTLSKFTAPHVLENSQITDDGASVGIGTATLNANIKLSVTGGTTGNSIRAVLNGTPATSIATSGSIYGESSNGIGVIGVSGTQNGVYGLSTGSLGGTTGVASGTGNGIWGVATGTGVAGFFDGGTNGRGIIVSTGSSGIGTTTPTGRLTVTQPATPVPALDTFAAIQAYSYTTRSCLKGGVYGTYNTSNYGTGLQGIGYNGINNENTNAAFGTGNQDLGVYGSANTAGVAGMSVGGIGVVGYNKNASFAATTGIGNTYGLYGNAQTVGGASVPNVRYGVYGFASGAPTNYAGYFSGNIQVTGSLSKGSGTFKIDHPLDPENKYLYHSFVESPDMMNIYNGNITTDASGLAVVHMPSYFSALNTDFRYQLTVIGTFAQAIVKQEMTNGRFVIQTSAPDIKVSWLVTGVRQDKYAQAHRVIPEVDKEQEFKGLYLHAAEWGLPESKSIDSKTRPQDNSSGDNSSKPQAANISEHSRKDQQQGVAGTVLHTR